MNAKCPLYRLQSKKQLKDFLEIKENKYLKNQFQDDINIFINLDGKPRLIEAPSPSVKNIQSHIKNHLQKCDFPSYVFSGIKGKCYYKNAEMHKNCKYMFKADISAFFPNISRNTVYNFFRNELFTSPDIAKILTDICTVDITTALELDNNIQQFINIKNIRQNKHLCTGSPASPILSYLVNRKMFDELNNIAEKNGFVFSVYVDDIFFSSLKPIPLFLQNKIIKTITKYGYNISKSKVTYYRSYEYKKVTGVIISPDNRLLVPNKLKKKIVTNFSKGKYKVSTQSLQGMLYAAKIIETDIFPNIQKHIDIEKLNNE